MRQQWEYKDIPVHPETLAQVLQQKGLEGWELCCDISGGLWQPYYLIFKRPTVSISTTSPPT